MNCEKCGRPLEGSGFFCTNCGHAMSYKEQPVQNQPEQPVYQQQNYQQNYQQQGYQQSAYQQPTYQPAAPAAAQKKENILTGIVGALIGAAIGGASIILLSQLGYVAGLSGLLLAVCTLKGYELLGGKLGTTGIIVSIVLMLVTPYIADRMDWAIVVMNQWGGYTFGEAFALIPDLLKYEYIEMGDYLASLGMVYLFVVIGAISTVITTLKQLKKK